MRLTRAFAVALAAAGAAACSDTNDPLNGDTTPITFNVCDTGFGWYAYQNEGGPWTQITPNASGQLSFEATDKVSVAMSISFFSSITQVINASAAELEAASGTLSCESFGDRSVSGTIAGVTGEQYVNIGAGIDVFDEADLVDPNWILDGLPVSSVDIVATRYPSRFTFPANRVFVRRGVIAQNNTIAALDFNNATESAAPEIQTATLAGAPTNSTVRVSSAVVTARGTEYELGSSGFTTGTAFAYLSLPASLRLQTDQHVLSAAMANGEEARGVDYFYETPAAKTLTFGPALSTPTITTAASTPYVRPRVQLAAQTEYATALRATFVESSGDFSANIISVVTTAAYAGGLPQSWDVTIPDMSAAGFPAASGLHGTDYTWQVEAHSTSTPGVLLGGNPPDGTTHTFAMRTNDPDLLALSRKSRPNLLSRAGVARYGARLRQP